PVLLVDPNQVRIQIPYEAGAGPAVLGINKNGEIAGHQFTLGPASPGVYADPNLSAKQGGYGTVYVAGIGETTPALRTGFTVPANTPASALARPALPLSVTIGGEPAFVQFAGVPAGLIGVAQVNFLVPADVPSGPQPLVVTVGGVSSAPVTLNVQ
ncbi:MAG TPA: peptidase S8, partial [Verrucomicrobiae bacterium]|nr:peptidase S8 [Verrucomicrobiae bacterium]